MKRQDPPWAPRWGVLSLIRQWIWGTIWPWSRWRIRMLYDGGPWWWWTTLDPGPLTYKEAKAKLIERRASGEKDDFGDPKAASWFRIVLYNPKDENPQ